MWNSKRRLMSLSDSNAKKMGFICVACGQTVAGLMEAKNQFELWKCAYCGTISTPNHIMDESLDELYTHYYDYAHFEIPSVVMQSLEQRILSFESYRQSGRILDIEFDGGALVASWRFVVSDDTKCAKIKSTAVVNGVERGQSAETYCPLEF